jgi:hypothetical protein
LPQLLQQGRCRITIAVGSAVIGILAMASLIRRMMPPRGNIDGEYHVLVADGQGFVVVEKRGIAAVAAEAILRVSGIIETEVQVSGRGAAPITLKIKCWAHAAADLKNGHQAVRAQAKGAVEELVGIPVDEVQVFIDIIPLEDLGRVVE